MFNLIWDKPANGVLLTQDSPDDAIAVAPRPVFFEELDLLGLEKHGWRYPRCAEPLLWACDRRYFYEGKLVMEAAGGNIYDAPVVTVHTPLGFTLKPVNLAELSRKNADLLFLLEYEALEFINTTWRRYAGAKKIRETHASIRLDFDEMRDRLQKKGSGPLAIVKTNCDSFDILPLENAEASGKQPLLSTKTELFIASFSGGKDSQVLLDLVTRAVPPDAFSVIYSDTGYEIPPSLEVYEQTRAFYKKRYPGLRFHLSKNHQSVLDYWDVLGAPSNRLRWCCSVMKTAPLYRKLKEINGTGKQPHVFCYDGVRAEESLRRSNYPRIGKGVKHNNVINARPILLWNVFEVFLYIFSHNLPFNTAYRRGITRAGCVICPFGSAWNEWLCDKLYHSTMVPFSDKLHGFIKKAGVSDVDDYFKEGKWKVRAGGNATFSDTALNIISQEPDFKAIIHNPHTDLLTWLKALGDFTIRESARKKIISLQYGKRIFEMELTLDENKNIITLEVKNIGNDAILFANHLKKILNKTAWCGNCESCEVECPTGALTVVPTVIIDAKKCIHCFNCLDFNGKGCVIAESLKTTTVTKMNNKTITKYDNFGLRELWLAKYFATHEIFFENEEHGLNVTKQIPALKHWLREAEVIEILPSRVVRITTMGKALAKRYTYSRDAVWHIIWINLTLNSGIAKWYSETMPFDQPRTIAELEVLLLEYFSDSKYSPQTIRSALNALRNTFKESPLGDAVPVGVSIDKTHVVRKSATSVSLAAIAYSLYRYAEKNQRHNLTVSEFYRETQKDGIARQFGLPRPAFETALRTLSEEKNRVLHADLNMGLDNIALREDIRSEDIPGLLL